MWTWNCSAGVQIKTKTISGSQLLKNTQIIKQTDLLFWKNWRKYGAVSYLFNCIWNYKFLTIKLFSHSNHLFYYVSVSTQWCVFYNWNNKSAWNFATIAKKMCDLAKINFFSLLNFVLQFLFLIHTWWIFDLC